MRTHGSAPASNGESPAHARERLLMAILSREAKGLPLNSAAVMRADSRIHRRIVRQFGTWDAALRAAGIEPERVRHHHLWSRKTIVERIQKRCALRLPLNAKAVQRDHPTLASAAQRWFGSWANALVAAGVDPSQWRMRAPKWTPEQIIDEIQRLRHCGTPLHLSANHGKSLTRAAAMLFGSWDGALQQAGLDPTKIRRYRKPWTREELLQEIRRKHAAGEPLNAGDVCPNHIQRVAWRFFGSWDAALAAAGLDPKTIRKLR
jgi:hypothetical protein